MTRHFHLPTGNEVSNNGHCTFGNVSFIAVEVVLNFIIDRLLRIAFGGIFARSNDSVILAGFEILAFHRDLGTIRPYFTRHQYVGSVRIVIVVRTIVIIVFDVTECAFDGLFGPIVLVVDLIVVGLQVAIVAAVAVTAATRTGATGTGAGAVADHQGRGAHHRPGRLQRDESLA